jgi:hypothetical protein
MRRYSAILVMQHVPSPFMGEGSCGGDTTALLPPILTFPRKGGRDLYLYLFLSGERAGVREVPQC